VAGAVPYFGVSQAFPLLVLTHTCGILQRGLQTGGCTHLSFSSQNLGSRQLEGVHLLLLACTVNFSEMFTSPVLMTSIRAPAGALDERVKVTVALAGVALLSSRLETPDAGLTLICFDVTLERSKKPDEFIVSVGEVPAVTVVGVTGSARASALAYNRKAKAAVTRTND
jgi:hypothetical protein